MSDLPFSAAPADPDVICEMSQAKFNLLRKMIARTGLEEIHIRQSVLRGRINAATTVETDLTGILGKGIDLHFRFTRETAKEWKGLRDSKVMLLKESDSQYTLTDGHVRCSLPITSGRIIDAVDIKYADRLAGFDDPEAVREFTRGSSYVLLHIFHEQLCCLSTDDRRKYFLDKEGYAETADTAPDTILKSRTFLAIDGDEVKYAIARDDYGYILVTETTITRENTIKTFEYVTNDTQRTQGDILPANKIERRPDEKSWT